MARHLLQAVRPLPITICTVARAPSPAAQALAGEWRAKLSRYSPGSWSGSTYSFQHAVMLLCGAGRAQASLLVLGDAQRCAWHVLDRPSAVLGLSWTGPAPSARPLASLSWPDRGPLTPYACAPLPPLPADTSPCRSWSSAPTPAT